MDQEELRDTQRKLFCGMQDNLNALAVQSNDLVMNIDFTVDTRVDSNGNPVIEIRPIDTMSIAEHVLADGETIESICMRYFGSLDRIQDILLYNGIASISDSSINLGDTGPTADIRAAVTDAADRVSAENDQVTDTVSRMSSALALGDLTSFFAQASGIQERTRIMLTQAALAATAGEAEGLVSEITKLREQIALVTEAQETLNAVIPLEDMQTIFDYTRTLQTHLTHLTEIMAEAVAALGGRRPDREDTTAGQDMVGRVIKIPLGRTVGGKARTAAIITYEPGTYNLYGADIALTDTGNVVINEHTHDFEMVTGAANLTQSILMRLRDSPKHRIRLTAYGITYTTSNAQWAVNYIINSVKQTIEADPRVESVERVDYEGRRDYLYITASYRDLNGVRHAVSEVF